MQRYLGRIKKDIRTSARDLGMMKRMLPYWIKIANITGWKRFKEALQIIPFKRMEHIRKELDIGYYNNKRIRKKKHEPGATSSSSQRNA